MAHLEKKTEHDAAYHCLLAAAEKYALSLFYSPNNPQVCPVTCRSQMWHLPLVNRIAVGLQKRLYNTPCDHVTCIQHSLWSQ